MENNILKIKKFFKTYSILSKLLISYFIIGVLIIFVFSNIVVRIVYKSGIQDINEVSKNNIVQAYNTADVLLSSTHDYFYNLYLKNSYIANALNSKNFDRLEVSSICKALDEQAQSNPLVYSIYVYNSNTNTIFTSITYAESVDNFFDKSMIDIIKNYSQYKKVFLIPRNLNNDIYGREINKNLITMVYAEHTQDGSIQSALIVNLDQKILQSILSNDDSGKVNKLFIVNNEGNVISHTDNKFFNTKISNIEYVNKILLSDNKTGYFNGKYNNSDLLVNYSKSSKLGWTFIISSDYSKLMARVNSMQRIIILIAILLVTVCIIIAAFFTGNIYMPLLKLLKEIKRIGAGQKKQTLLNECDYLKNTIDNLVTNNKNLQSNISKFVPTKKKEILIQLMNGEYVDSLKTEDALNKYDLKFSKQYFLVVLFRFDSYNDLLKKYTAKDMALYRFAVLNIACEIMDRKFRNEGIEVESDNMAVIVNLDKKDNETLTILKGLINEINSKTKDIFNFTVTASIGSAVNKLEDISYSYKDALRLVGYRLVYGKNSVICFWENKLLDLEQEYPIDVEKQLIDAIKQKNRKKVELSLGDFFDIIACYTPDEILMSTLQMSMTFVKQIIRLEDGKYNKFTNYGDIYSRINSLDTINEIKDFILNIICQWMDEYACEESSKKIIVLTKVKWYMDTNFQDSDLTIEKISEYVDLSPNYVRKMFKEEYGKSIFDYLSELRFSKAQELLKDTDEPIKNIAEQVGFADFRYFYVAFKKHYGKSAAEYRAEVK